MSMKDIEPGDFDATEREIERLNAAQAPATKEQVRTLMPLLTVAAKVALSFGWTEERFARAALWTMLVTRDGEEATMERLRARKAERGSP